MRKKLMAFMVGVVVVLTPLSYEAARLADTVRGGLSVWYAIAAVATGLAALFCAAVLGCSIVDEL